MRTYFKPNYETLFDSAVTGLQAAANEYKKAVIENLGLQWITSDGRLVYMSGIEERIEHIKRLHADIERLRHDVEHYRRMMEEQG